MNLVSQKEVKPEDKTNGDIIKDIMKVCVPATLTMFLYFSMEVIGAVFNGHLPEAEQIAGAGLCNMYCIILCLSFAIGLNSALSTLISQTFGTGNMYLCGVYLNRARVMATIVFIALQPILLSAEYLFLALKFDAKTSHYAQIQIYWKIPGLLGYVYYDATKRLLYNTGNQNIPLYIQLGTTLFHPLWCYLFLHQFGLGIRATAMAYSITNIANTIILLIIVTKIDKLKDAIFWPNKDCFKGLGEYFRIGIFSAAIILFEWSAFDFMTLMSGFLGVNSTGAQSVLYNFECLIYMPALGLQIATSAVVGNSIGSKNADLARRYARWAQIISLIETITIIIFVWFCRNLIAEFYTDIDKVELLTADALRYVAFVQLWNQQQACQQGIMRGLGKVGLATFSVLTSYYVFTLPLGYIFAFHVGENHETGKGMGINGLWLGMFLGQLVLCAMYQFFISFKIDWHAIVKDSQDRAEKDEKLLSENNNDKQNLISNTNQNNSSRNGQDIELQDEQAKTTKTLQ
eukprot:403372185